MASKLEVTTIEVGIEEIRAALVASGLVIHRDATVSPVMDGERFNALRFESRDLVKVIQRTTVGTR